MEIQETWLDLFGEQLAQMNNISAKLSERQFDKIIEEALEIAFTNFDYNEDRGFTEVDMQEAIYQAIVSFIKV
jgi:ketol-acid reductoisomerase